MSRLSKYLSIALCSSALLISSQSVSAGNDKPDITVLGSKQVPIVLHNDANNLSGNLSDGSPVATVSMPMLKISPDALAELQKRVEDIKNSPSMPKASASLPRVKVGMNGVPVLNQGVHGTCVTFAVTAALDASLYQKDQLSQLCSLELGAYLESVEPRYISGWEGSFAPLVLEQFETFGAVDKRHEKSGVCGGLKSYPVRSAFTGDPIHVEDYLKISNDVMQSVDVEEILSADHAFSRRVNRNAVIENMKLALQDGNRIVVGLGLDPSAYNAGFVGRHQTDADTWVVTNSLTNKVLSGKLDQLGYHEVVIHGYDDTVVVNGQQGVFILRNSWSDRFGDHGDAYVTYDYVKLLLTEANAIKAK